MCLSLRGVCLSLRGGGWDIRTVSVCHCVVADVATSHHHAERLTL